MTRSRNWASLTRLAALINEADQARLRALQDQLDHNRALLDQLDQPPPAPGMDPVTAARVQAGYALWSSQRRVALMEERQALTLRHAIARAEATRAHGRKEALDRLLKGGK